MITDTLRVQVIVGVLIQDDKVLVAFRPEHLHQGGLWEFPGGKIEAAEAPEDALRRELAEEIGVVPRQFRRLISIPYDYPGKPVRLDVRLVWDWDGCPRGVEGQQIEWRRLSELDARRFPAANRSIIRALRLAPIYAITPELAELPDFGFDAITSKFAEQPVFVQLRTKRLSFSDMQRLLGRLNKVSERHRSVLLVNSSIEGWCDLDGVDGVQLTSSDLMRLSERPTSSEQLTGASCHTGEQLHHASRLGLDFCVLSPVMATKSHPAAKPLGWQRFAELVRQTDLPVYALGGLGMRDVGIAQHHGAQGVAGISEFFP